MRPSWQENCLVADKRHRDVRVGFSKAMANVLESSPGQNSMNRVLLDRYLCPQHFVDTQRVGDVSDDAGYFRFGRETICYGRCSSGFAADSADANLHDALADVSF